jgi:hypothetical protein
LLETTTGEQKDKDNKDTDTSINHQVILQSSYYYRTSTHNNFTTMDPILAAIAAIDAHKPEDKPLYCQTTKNIVLIGQRCGKSTRA